MLGRRAISVERLNVEVCDAQGVVFDEATSRFDYVAHQSSEDVVGFDAVLDADLNESFGSPHHRRFR